MPDLIAVDLGGTNIRVARFAAPEPPPIAIQKTPTLAAEGPEAVVGRMIALIEQMTRDSGGPLRIGVGAPGPLDPGRGVVLEAPNLPGWIDFPLRDRLAGHFGCPVAVGNDANLAALGEWRFGAGRGARHMLYLTVGTGIGGGVIIDGRLLLGARGLGGELGHMTVDPNGPPCACGARGHLEAMACGPAIARAAAQRLAAGEASSLRDLPPPLTAEAIGRAAVEGDALARQVVAQAGQAIGLHLANLAHAFDPQVIVLGGGVSLIGPPLFEPLERALRAHILHQHYLEGLAVLPAALGDDAGLVGAMVLASDT